MEQLDIRKLLENIERKVYQQEITTSSDVNSMINTEITKAINLNSSAKDNSLQTISCTTIECYLEHLKAVEAKLQKPCDITAQCKPVEEREINRRLLLILNRLKRYNRE